MTDMIELIEEELDFYKIHGLHDVYKLCYKRILERLIFIYYSCDDNTEKEFLDWIVKKYKFYYIRKRHVFNSITTLKTRIRYMLFFVNREIYARLVFKSYRGGKTYEQE